MNPLLLVINDFGFATVTYPGAALGVIDEFRFEVGQPTGRWHHITPTGSTPGACTSLPKEVYQLIKSVGKRPGPGRPKNPAGVSAGRPQVRGRIDRDLAEWVAQQTESESKLISEALINLRASRTQI